MDSERERINYTSSESKLYSNTIGYQSKIVPTARGHDFLNELAEHPTNAIRKRGD